MCGHIPVTLALSKTMVALGFRFVWLGRRTGGSLCIYVWAACWVGTSASSKRNRPTKKPGCLLANHFTICWVDLTVMQTEWAMNHSIESTIVPLKQRANKDDKTRSMHCYKVNANILSMSYHLCLFIHPSATSLSFFQLFSSICLCASVINAKCSKVEDVGFSRKFSRCCLCVESWMCPWGFRSGPFPGNWIKYYGSQCWKCSPLIKIRFSSFYFTNF